MKIGEIVERLATTVRTPRFYEERGLVHPRRTPGGTRIYSAANETRFSALLALARLGFSLQTLSELAAIRVDSSSGDEASRKVSARLQAMDDELEERGRAIERQRQDIARAMALVERCHGCQQRPIRTVCDRCEIGADMPDGTVLQVAWDEPAAPSPPGYSNFSTT